MTVKKCFIKASYIHKNPACFGPYSRTIFRGRSSLLVPTTLQLHASSYACIGMWSYALCLYLYPVYLPVCCLVVLCTTRQHTGRYTENNLNKSPTRCNNFSDLFELYDDARTCKLQIKKKNKIIRQTHLVYSYLLFIVELAT
jgi:hypothetical protein